MAIEVKLPELGDGITSGDVIDVFVNQGDVIAKDQAVCELETDKATVEVPSSHAGKIVKVHIASGQTVPIGATMLTLEAVPSEAETADDPSAPQAVEQSAAPSSPDPSPKPDPPAAESSPAPHDQPAATPTSPSELPAPAIAATTSASTAAAGPSIRRLAREVGIDLGQIRGTGSGGRITRDDVLSAVRRSSSAQASPPDEKTDAGADTTDSSPSTTSTTSTADDWGPIQVERMTKIRKTIATKMHESWSTVPRVTNFDDADVTELERIRQASKADYVARGIKLTSMPFVIKAVALALRKNPEVNASLDEANDQIIYKQYVNVGIAVDTERGLVVPSLRRPDELSIPDIARSLGSIAENARTGKFKIQDLRGSTFSISNLGAVGGTYSTPIISVPEVAILLLGRSRKMQVVIDDQVAIRLMMPLSLSYDHRLVDGAKAARFLNDVIDYLEHPSRLLIAP